MRRVSLSFFQALVKEVAVEYEINPEKVMTGTKLRKYTIARQEIMLRLRERVDENGVILHSFPAIGAVMKKDHTTVIHGCKRAKSRREEKAQKEV